MNVSTITQSILYNTTGASGMLQTTSSASSSYEELQNTEELIAQKETNTDGQLSIDDMFSTADEDGDGYLTQEELEDYLTSGPDAAGGAQALSEMDAASILESEDADENGTLSFEETTLTEEMFATADSDGDGSISSDELEDYLASAPEGTRGTGGPPPGGMPSEEEEEEEEDETSTSAANASAISAYERVSSNFMNIMTGSSEMYTNSFLSGLVV